MQKSVVTYVSEDSKKLQKQKKLVLPNGVWAMRLLRKGLANQKFTRKSAMLLLMPTHKYLATSIKLKIVHVPNIVSPCFTVRSTCIFFLFQVEINKKATL